MTLTDISFECSTCGQRLVADAAGAGSQVACPNCEADVTIPPNGDRAICVVRRDHGHNGSTSDLERELQNARTDLHSLRSESDRTAAALAQTGAELKLLLDEQGSWQENRRRLETARTQAEQSLQQSQTERAELAETLEKSRKRVAKLEAKLAKAKPGAPREAEPAPAADVEARAPAKAKEASPDAAALEAKLAALEAKLAEREAALHAAETAGQKAAEALQQTVAERDQLAAYLEARHQRVAELKTHVAAHEQHLAEREATFETLVLEHSALDDRYRHTEADRLKTAAHLQEAMEECTGLHEALETAKRRILEHQAQLAETQAESKERNATIHSLLSWKEEAEESFRQLDEYRAQAEQDLAQVTAEKADLTELLEVNRSRGAALEAQLEGRERECEERGNTIEMLRAELAEEEAALVQTRSELEVASTVAEQVPGLEAECDGLVEEVTNLETERDELLRLSEERATIIAELEAGLAKSQEGRDLLAIHERAHRAEQERDGAHRLRSEAEKEAAKAKADAARWQEDCEQMARRFRDAEARAESGTAGPEDEKMRLLREILDRQAAELGERCREVAKFRRERFALRLAYTAVGGIVLGLIAIGLKLAQHFIEKGWF